MRKKLLWISTLFFAVTSLFAQSFPCDGAFYVVMIVNGKSLLHNLQFDESGQLRTRAIPLSEPNRQYTCLGMSIADLHLYALDFHTKELLRIDASGNVINLGVPEDLDLNLDYWAGDVSPEGRRLLVIGKDKTTGIDKSIFSINLTIPNHYAGSASVLSYLKSALTDIAIDPVRGIRYGYDKINKQIVTIGINTVTHYSHIAIEPVLESLFFDKQGNLYAYGSSSSEQEQSTLYAIDKIRGGATAIASSETGLFSDGCSCPYSLYFSRTITPSVLLPCSEFTINYRIINHAGIGKTGVFFQDLLPPSFMITEMGDHTFTLGRIESAEGTNELVIANLDILIGENVMQIKGVLDATPGESYETQAIMENLPLGLGERLVSDNPQTVEPMDPNIVTVYQVNSLQLENYLSYNCKGDTAIISLPFHPATVEWSTGSQELVLRVTEAGRYGVKASWDCFSLEEYITIEDFPEPLALDLGDDLEVTEGTPLYFPFETNARQIRQLSWWSAREFDLSCEDCRDPRGNATQNNTYFLALTDDRGCSVVDSIQVSVVPARDIYVPNVFSPNGDGVNDVFYVQGVEGIGIVKYFLIFDRWGNLIFETREANINDPGCGWNGRLNGALVNEGTYVWLVFVEYWDGQTAKLSGQVAVLNK